MHGESHGPEHSEEDRRRLQEEDTERVLYRPDAGQIEGAGR